MKIAWNALGRTLFWISWPALWFYLRQSRRTRVMVICEDRLLVSKTWIGDGRWGLPGGGMHKNETAPDGVLRELREETGISLAATDLQYVSQHTMHVKGLSIHYDFFRTELKEFTPLRLQAIEVSDAQWLTASELAAQKLQPDVTEALAIWTV